MGDGVELHETIRELVAEHGRSVLDDATGFRGLLDDVLAESDATTGEINLLVDAIRFDAVNPLVAMIEGGADPDRAVQEAGLRLARNRGGDDHGSASWAAAVLGYALDKVPAPVLARYRSQRPPGSVLPGSAQAPPPTMAPPPPTQSPTQSPVQSPIQAPPTQYPGQASRPSTPGWPAASGSAPDTSGYAAPPPPPGYGSAPNPAAFAGSSSGSYSGPFSGSVPTSSAPAKKRGPGLWIALAAVFVVLIGGGIVTAVVLTGGEPDDPDGPDTPTVDLSAEALDERYASLGTDIAAVGGECTAPDPEDGQSEVVECAMNAGTLRLVTYADAEALQAFRDTRVDTRAGTLSDKVGSSVFYEYDPTNTGNSDAAVIYWDNANGPQSAELTGTEGGEGGEGTELATLEALFTNTGPTITAPTAPSNDLVREFIGVTHTVADCTRGTTYGEGATEESVCSPRDDISVVVARYESRREMLSQRRYYRRTWRSTDTRGDSDFWRFGTDGAKEGAYYGYEDAGTSTLYWDWDRKGCNCYAVAFGYDVPLDDLEGWWSS